MNDKHRALKNSRLRARVVVLLFGGLVTSPLCGVDQAEPLDKAMAQGANPFEGDEQAIRDGAVLFRQNCVGCHGPRGRGGKGPDLTDTRWLHGSRDGDLFRVIRNGVRGTTMKGMVLVFPDDRLWKIIAFIRSLARSEDDPAWRPYLPGDAVAGKKLYFDEKGRAACVKCHALNGAGGNLGPPLSRIAAIRSRKYLMDSLVRPSADIDPNYEGVVVVTKQGRVISGLRLNEDNFSIQFRDQQTDRYYSVPKRELEEVRKQKKSLMPENLTEQLTVKELHDLFAYLMTLGEEPTGPKVKGSNSSETKASNTQ
jgi:putative heme-binding domain-containing protein